jgi:hypothetical protein
MSFKLRYNLFFAVTQQAVYRAYEEFWTERGYHLVQTHPANSYTFTLLASR